jgi:hypothetical protein
MKILAATALCLVPIAAPALAKPAAELSAGVEQQSGDYGTGEPVDLTAVRGTVRIEEGRFFLYGSLPYQRIEAPGNVVGGGGTLLGLPIIIDPTQPDTREAREGLGDLRVGAGYRLAGPAGIGLAVAGEVKLPTASARRGLGTGETDVTVAAEASRTFGAITPFASVSFTMPGDPEEYRLRDSVAVRGGLAAQLGRAVRGSIAYGHAQSLSPLVPDERQVSGRLNVGLSDGLSLGLHGNAGLSDGAADMGAGVQIGWRLF